MKWLKLIYLVTWLFIGAQTKAQTVIDSLLQVRSFCEDTALAEWYNQAAYQSRNNNIEHALLYADSAIYYSKKINYPAGEANGYVNRANYFKITGQMAAAKGNYIWAGILFNKAQHVKGFSSALNGLANLAYLEGKLAVALHYFFESLKLSESINDIKGMAVSFNNIGVVYSELENNKMSLNYYLKAYQWFSRINDINNMADALNNIGNAYNQEKNYDKALEYYNEAINLNIKIGDLKDESTMINNIGMIYNERKDYKAAIAHFLKSLAIDEELKNQQAIAITCQNIANCYYEMKMFFAAKKYALKSLNIKKAQNFKLEMASSYEILYKINNELGHYKEALAYYKLFDAYNDSLNTEISNQQLHAIEARYKNDKEQLMRGYNKPQAKPSTIHLLNDEINSTILIIAVVLISFVGGIYLIFFIAKRK